jgi:hypothetical protein
MTELQEQGRVHEYANPDHRLAAVSLAYTARRDRSVVVAPDAGERNELRQQGWLAAESRVISILVKQDFGNPRVAAKYAPGDEIHYKAGSPAEHGIADNSAATVLSVDARANTFTVATRDGNEVYYNPALLKRQTAQSTVYREEQREVAAGERIRFTDSDRNSPIRSGDFATVERIGENSTLSVRVDNGTSVELVLILPAISSTAMPSRLHMEHLLIVFWSPGMPPSLPSAKRRSHASPRRPATLPSTRRTAGNLPWRKPFQARRMRYCTMLFLRVSTIFPRRTCLRSGSKDSVLDCSRQSRLWEQVFENHDLQARCAGETAVVCHKECCIARLRRGELNGIGCLVSPVGSQLGRFDGNLRRHRESLYMGSVQEYPIIPPGQSSVSLSQRMNQDLSQCDRGRDDLNVATLNRFKERSNQG